MATEDSVQVSTGQLIRTIKLTRSIDGVETEVELQAVAISDADGNVFDPRRLLDAIETLTDEVRALHESYRFSNGM